jgi:hypothetical protein
MHAYKLSKIKRKYFLTFPEEGLMSHNHKVMGGYQKSRSKRPMSNACEAAGLTGTVDSVYLKFCSIHRQVPIPQDIVAVVKVLAGIGTRLWIMRQRLTLIRT